MEELFEEQGWVVVSIIGGAIGLSILYAAFFLDDAPIRRVFDTILEGLIG